MNKLSVADQSALAVGRYVIASGFIGWATGHTLESDVEAAEAVVDDITWPPAASRADALWLLSRALEHVENGDFGRLEGELQDCLSEIANSTLSPLAAAKAVEVVARRLEGAGLHEHYGAMLDAAWRGLEALPPKAVAADA